MLQRIKTRLSSLSLAGWALVGAVLGIATGLFFGDACSILASIGVAYVMMLQMAAYPLIICLVILGIGGLSREKCARLFKHRWPFYGIAFGVTLCVLFALWFAIPTPPPPASIDAAKPPETGTSLLTILIPANVFEALMRNYLPGVVLFSIVFGIAIQHLPAKERFLHVIGVVRDGCTTIVKWVLRLAPVAVYAMLAKTAGCTELRDLLNVLLYLVLFIGGVLLLVLWLLPAIMSASMPLGYREIMREFRNALVLAGTTSMSIIALPFVHRAALRLAKECGGAGEDCEEVVDTNLSISYVLGHLGNLVAYPFALFAVFYFKAHISRMQFILLPFVTAIASIGTSSTTNNTVEFLRMWLNLPPEMMQLFLETSAITWFAQTLLSAMGFAFLTTLVTLSYYGRLRINLWRLVPAVLPAALLLAALVFGVRVVERRLLPTAVDPRLSFALDRSVTHGIDATIDRDPVESGPSRVRAGEATFQRIHRTGVLRVGYFAHRLPFAYLNEKGQLVGYDISFAYDLARTLNVQLEFVPLRWETLVDDLCAARFDIAMSGTVVSPERLAKLTVSQPYFHSAAGLIVRSEDTEEFLDVDSIRAMGPLKIAVFHSPFTQDLVHQLLPGSQTVFVDGYGEIERDPSIDAVLCPFEIGACWTAGHPGFVTVKPRNFGSVSVFAYLMPPHSIDLCRFVDHCLAMRRADGFIQQEYDYWILGKPRPRSEPRWCILRNVLHWVE